jgi:hypothetical protein
VDRLGETSAMGEAAASLSIGSVIGGQGHAAQQWRDPIRRLQRRVAKLRVGVDSPLNVNVVFHVPGEHAAPDYEGVRTGHYSRRDALLVMQAAIPAGLAADDRVLDALLVDAINEAERWAKTEGVTDSLERLKALAEAATA